MLLEIAGHAVQDLQSTSTAGISMMLEGDAVSGALCDDSTYRVVGWDIVYLAQDK